MNLLLACQKNEDIAWWQLFVDFYAFFNSAVNVTLGSISFVEDGDWEHFRLHLQYWDMKVK